MHAPGSKMFQLNSNNGKFDIVFSDNPVKERAGKKNNLSNAGIRTRKEYRSSVLSTIQAQAPQKSKIAIPVKQPPLQHFSPDGNVHSAVPHQDSLLKKHLSEKRYISKAIPRPINKSHPVIRGNRASQLRGKAMPSNIKKQDDDELKIYNNKKQIQKPKMTNNQVKNHSKQNDFQMGNHKNLKNNPSTEKLSNNHNISGRDDNKTENRIRNNVNKIPQQMKYNESKPKHIESKDEAGILSQKQLEDIFQDFFDSSKNTSEESKHDNEHANNVDTKHITPSVVPGLENDFSQSKNMNASYKSSKAQQESLNSYRYEDIRRKQSTPEEEYNPWGKPGGGAPSKQGTGNIRSGIKKYNLLQKKEFEESVDNLNHKSPRSPVYDNLSPRKNNGPFDMDDYEARQQKHNEHMDAIKAQVEEKRRLRKLEKEKQLEEEKKAEERYRKQQELLEQRYEEERIREKEKNEIRKARQQALEEALHKAEEETKKAKFEEQNKKRQQIKPSNDSTSYLSSKQTSEKKRPIKPRKKLMSTYTITVDKGDENIQQQDSSTSADISKFMGTYTLHDPVDNFRNNSDSMSDEESYENLPTTGNDKNYHGHSPKTNNFEDNAARKRHNFRNQANLSSSFLPSSSSESDDNERYATKMQKKPEDGMFSDGSVITEYLPSPTNSPSMRQQKILDQLKNLREGLMRKQMEYLSVH